MRKFLKNHKGVTMVEVLVTVAILAIVVAPCLSAFVMAQRGNVKAAETQAAYTAAANLMEELKGLPKDDVVNTINETLTLADDGISAFCETKDAYFVITIYAGELAEQPAADSGVEPILKGVIAP